MSNSGSKTCRRSKKLFFFLHRMATRALADSELSTSETTHDISLSRALHPTALESSPFPFHHTRGHRLHLLPISHVNPSRRHASAPLRAAQVHRVPQHPEEITAGGTRVWLGTYNTPEEAVCTFDAPAWRFRRGRAALNFSKIQCKEEAEFSRATISDPDACGPAAPRAVAGPPRHHWPMSGG
jgi:hypothetical protein